MTWGLEDFVVAGGMLLAVSGAFFLARKQSDSLAYLLAFGIALGALFLLVWVSLAVGIIGDGSHPANLAFALVAAVAVIGMAVSRLRARGLSRTMFAAAGLQVLAGITATCLTALEPGMPGLLVVFAFTQALAGAFALSGWLFRVDDGVQIATRAASLLDGRT